MVNEYMNINNVYNVLICTSVFLKYPVKTLKYISYKLKLIQFVTMGNY